MRHKAKDLNGLMVSRAHRLMSLSAYQPISLLCAIYLASIAICGCGKTGPKVELPTASKGYILYVFAGRTEVMIDFCRSDGLSRGTKLDVFRMDVPGMDEPVKIGEIAVEKVGRRMSKARATAFPSSLRMQRGDRVFPHPIVVISDASWIASRRPADGWKSDFSLPEEQAWEQCEVLPHRRNITPEVRQLVSDTGVEPIWHPSVKSHHGDVFFRKGFYIDARPATASMSVLCSGRTNIYLNDRWVGEAAEWPEISSFRVNTFLEQGRNLIAVHVVRESRPIAPPVLFLALTVQTEFR